MDAKKNVLAPTTLPTTPIVATTKANGMLRFGE
jgi:hypothetical protein